MSGFTAEGPDPFGKPENITVLNDVPFYLKKSSMGEPDRIGDY